MLDFVTEHAVPIQVGCVALALLVLAPLVVLKSARAYAWTVRRSRELHGEFCECVYCDQLADLRQRVDFLESEIASLRAARNEEWRLSTART